MRSEPPGGPASDAPPGDDPRARRRPRRSAGPSGQAARTIGVLLLALAGCAGRGEPDGQRPSTSSSIPTTAPAPASAPSGATEGGGEGVEPVVAETAAVLPPEVGRPAAGPDSLAPGPPMTFIDPGTLPDRLLWLRADRGVTGGSAAHWNGTTNTRLYIGGRDDLQTGDIDFAFACWVRANTLPGVTDPDGGERHIAGKWERFGSSLSEWLLSIQSVSGTEQFRLFVVEPNTKKTIYGPHTSYPGGIEAGRWYFLVAWHDSVNDTLNLSVDGQLTGSMPYASGLVAQWLPFHLGKSRWRDGYPVISMSRAAFFKGTPGGIAGQVGDIVTALYNGGDGADAREIAPDRLRAWGLHAYWPLDESGGTRADIWGENPANLLDPSGVGSTLSPLVRPAEDTKVVSGWADEHSGRSFHSPDSSAGVSWRGDFTRLVSASSASRLVHDGLVLSGRPSWTMSLVGATRFDGGFGLYGESSGPSDDDTLEIRVDHDGVPELAVRSPGGPEVVARASGSLAHRRAATAAGVETLADPGDGVPRVRCRVELGDGHPFANCDRVRVRGLGPPYDGYHSLTFATPTQIHYIIDHPASSPATAGARRVPGASSSRNTLDRRLPASWSGSQWSVAGWVRKTADGQDAASGGADLFAAKDFSDRRTMSSRPHVLHAGDGTPGSYRLSLPDGPSGDFGPATRDVWVHLAAVRSGDVITLYYDGTPAASIDVSNDPSMGSTFTGFGFGFGSNVSATLPCLLDNWGIWLGRSLSATDVSALHGGGSGPDFDAMEAELRDGLTAWYDFDEVSGAAADASGNGHDLVERGLVPAGEGVGGGIPFDSAIVSGLVVGSGRTQVHDRTLTDAENGSEYLRYVLTVRRDGGVVSFFRNGEPIGSSAIDPSVVGPASGTARLLSPTDRLRAPVGAIEHVLASGEAQTDEQVAGLGALLSVRVNRTAGVGPLAVFFDATSMARVDRMARQDYQYLWAFTRAGEVALHDGSTAPWSGQAYARSTGFFVSQVFEAEGSYDAHLAVITPPYDRQGRPQPRSCLFAGKVATVEVEPWPDSTIDYYVSSSHPARSDSNPGTSPDAPLATIVQAVSKIDRPYVRILMKTGDEFPIGTQIRLSSINGPLLIGPYGDPAAGRPTLIASTRGEFDTNRSVTLENARDIRISGIAIQDTGINDSSSPEYAKIAFWGGNSRLILLHDLDIRDTHRFLYLLWEDRTFVIDRCRIESRGDYMIFAEVTNALSITRCDLEATPWEHLCRNHNNLRTQISHCFRTSGPYIIAPNKSWMSVRWEARYVVVTDNFGQILGYTVGGDQDHGYIGPQWGIVERNDLAMIHGQADELSIRNNYFRSDVTVLSSKAVRGGTSEDWRFYGNIQNPDKTLFALGGSQPLVNEANSFLNSGVLTVPEIGTAAAVPGAAVLVASGPGSGPQPWAFRWMRRRAGDDGPFRPLEGQTASALLDLPEQPGTYEYRLDAVDSTGAEALGSGSVTVAIPAAGPEADYTLTPPGPRFGLVGQLSGPFTVSLPEDIDPAGSIVITPRCDGPGRFRPVELTLSASERTATFRYLPDRLGASTISTTNNAGLVDPEPVTFLVTRVLAPLPNQERVGLESPDVLPPTKRPSPGLAPRPSRDDPDFDDQTGPPRLGRPLVPRPPARGS